MQINLPSGGTEYDARLRVMLYQYLRAILRQIPAVATAEATLTVPSSSTSHTETVSLPGCTTASKVIACLAPTTPADANEVVNLHVIALAAEPGDGEATVTIVFGVATTGAVKVNLLAA